MKFSRIIGLVLISLCIGLTVYVSVTPTNISKVHTFLASNLKNTPTPSVDISDATLDKISDIDDDIEYLVDSDNFGNANTKKRSELVLDLLTKLEQEGLIQADSIRGPSGYPANITFKYFNGWQGGVYLEDFDSDIN